MKDADPPHPIIDRPHEFRIRSLRFEVARAGREGFVDLELIRGSVVRRLRFWSPQTLQIEEGFPHPRSGMEICDVSARQLEGLGVHVADCEATRGAITFWARDVIDLDATGRTIPPDTAS